MPQALVEAGGNALLVANLGTDNPVGVEPSLHDCRDEKVASRYAPPDLAGRPWHDASGQQRGRGTIRSTIATAGNLVECPTCQAAAR
ncbi:MAG: hypothetical protein H7Z10_15245 [Gemmatimonadaceae bacterium]|nr:hypothetical protein [Acetobacteraceae bacterium]